MRSVSIFVVEDEALIRMMIADMLEEIGHRVVAEAGSIQAAEPLARNTIFDLAILDINIGGFPITPIAQIIDTRGLPFFFSSGYGPEGRPIIFDKQPVVRKPYVIEQLRAQIDATLAEHASLQIAKREPGDIRQS